MNPQQQQDPLAFQVAQCKALRDSVLGTVDSLPPRKRINALRRLYQTLREKTMMCASLPEFTSLEMLPIGQGTRAQQVVSLRHRCFSLMTECCESPEANAADLEGMCRGKDCDLRTVPFYWVFCVKRLIESAVAADLPFCFLLTRTNYF
ncbi:hypothetical protein niasHS_016641 [Heterodera schachtii]|uniref:Uncharacterized protein n=1 Tax=Heterodera schachtii TaxID=97005 RepID=A0ABD2HZ32_HETSC